jgi:hypothetical protein
MVTWAGRVMVGVPLIPLGAVVAGLGRAGRPVPASVGWVSRHGVWACAAVFEPSPFITAMVRR